MGLKKRLYTLLVDDFDEELVSETLPWIKFYARKIKAEFFIIKERKFPGWPPVYEKLQIYELGRDVDWNIYIDADALIFPEMPDVTDYLAKDTVCCHGKDLANQRFLADRFFRRDGRYIGVGNWFTLGSDWCIELWEPLQDLTFEEACKNIMPTSQEMSTGLIDPQHLIDDYTLSRNVARYGLKHITILDLFTKFQRPHNQLPYFHTHLMSREEKLHEIRKIKSVLGLSPPRHSSSP